MGLSFRPEDNPASARVLASCSVSKKGPRSGHGSLLVNVPTSGRDAVLLDNSKRYPGFGEPLAMVVPTCEGCGRCWGSLAPQLARQSTRVSRCARFGSPIKEILSSGEYWSTWLISMTSKPSFRCPTCAPRKNSSSFQSEVRRHRRFLNSAFPASRFAINLGRNIGERLAYLKMRRAVADIDGGPAAPSCP
jgi:hypothetical protein